MGGLTLDQLRWIFTSYSVGELDHSGWQPESVPFADGDDSTRMWSELNENCTAAEILIAGPPAGTSAYDFFTTYVLPGNDEVPRDYFKSSDIKALDSYMHDNGATIAFFQMHDMLSVEYAQEIGSLAPVPIMDKYGDFIEPNAGNYDSYAYPLLRNVYLGLNKDPASLDMIRPFLEFGFSSEGTKILQQSGFWPLQEWEKTVMYTRMQSTRGIPMDKIAEHCGPPNGEISIAGSTAVQPVSHMWASLFKVGCAVNAKLEAGGTNMGAARLCADMQKGKPVDIGNLSRDWKASEGQERELDLHFVHDCVQGDTRRSAILVDVALDGISVVLPLSGAGHACVTALGGLSKDQLRWIYSSYDEAKLKETGWNPASLKNSDGDPQTHFWSELDVNCEHSPIYLAGGVPGDGDFTAFSEHILEDTKNGETIAQGRSESYFSGSGYDILLDILKKDGIGFVGYYYYFQKQDLFWAAPIEGADSSFISPSIDTIRDDTYPLVRSLHMNLLNHEASLQNTVPMMEFGFDHPDLLSNSGYTPLPEARRIEMLQRMRGGPYTAESLKDEEEEGFDMSRPVFVVAAVVFVALCGLAGYVVARVSYSKKQ